MSTDLFEDDDLSNVRASDILGNSNKPSNDTGNNEPADDGSGGGGGGEKGNSDPISSETEEARHADKRRKTVKVDPTTHKRSPTKLDLRVMDAEQKKDSSSHPDPSSAASNGKRMAGGAIKPVASLASNTAKVSVSTTAAPAAASAATNLPLPSATSASEFWLCEARGCTRRKGALIPNKETACPTCRCLRVKSVTVKSPMIRPQVAPAASTAAAASAAAAGTDADGLPLDLALDATRHSDQRTVKDMLRAKSNAVEAASTVALLKHVVATIPPSLLPSSSSSSSSSSAAAAAAPTTALVSYQPAALDMVPVVSGKVNSSNNPLLKQMAVLDNDKDFQSMKDRLISIDREKADIIAEYGEEAWPDFELLRSVLSVRDPNHIFGVNVDELKFSYAAGPKGGKRTFKVLRPDGKELVVWFPPVVAGSYTFLNHFGTYSASKDWDGITINPMAPPPQNAVNAKYKFNGLLVPFNSFDRVKGMPHSVTGMLLRTQINRIERRALWWAMTDEPGLPTIKKWYRDLNTEWSKPGKTFSDKNQLRSRDGLPPLTDEEKKKLIFEEIWKRVKHVMCGKDGEDKVAPEDGYSFYAESFFACQAQTQKDHDGNDKKVFYGRHIKKKDTSIPEIHKFIDENRGNAYPSDAVTWWVTKIDPSTGLPKKVKLPFDERVIDRSTHPAIAIQTSFSFTSPDETLSKSGNARPGFTLDLDSLEIARQETQIVHAEQSSGTLQGTTPFVLPKERTSALRGRGVPPPPATPPIPPTAAAAASAAAAAASHPTQSAQQTGMGDNKARHIP